MKRKSLLILAVCGLAACEPVYVDEAPAPGVGFSNYRAYSASQIAREADARAAAERRSSVTLPPGTRTDIPAPLPAGATAPLPPLSTALPPTPGSTAAAAPAPAPAPAVGVIAPVVDNAGRISDEQDFSAVASRETIESDKARIEANKAKYTQVPTTALPERPVADAATIVEFALSTNNAVGQAIYSRSTILAQSRFERNCGKYPSQDKAQEAFLASGGPKRDPKGLDPDGDGFACYWDPAPFRSAKMGAPAAPTATEVLPVE